MKTANQKIANSIIKKAKTLKESRDWALSIVVWHTNTNTAQTEVSKFINENWLNY